MKIAIIGGAGKMGRWFARLLKEEGHQVVISGRRRDKLEEAGHQLGVRTATSTDAIQDAEVVLISVPIDAFDEVVREIGYHIAAGQKVIDLTSVKEAPVAAMHRYLKSAAVLGAHPLFGPGARSLAHQNFVLTPTSTAERALAEKITGYLEERGARVRLMTPREHDEMMAVVLGLSHFIAIVAADTLLTSAKPARMEAVSGVTYRVLLTLIESVLSEDPELYASLQMHLPGMGRLEQVFQEKAQQWTTLVQNKDAAGFAGRMQELKEKLAGESSDFGKAYANMYKIAEGL